MQSNNNNNNNFIQVNGIMSQGYGFSPKVVMRDTRLTVEAKAIYAYMSSFAGSGLTAFPKIELQLYELGMGAKRYYKHRKLLEDLGYITIKQTRIKKDNGKVVGDKNIYILEQFPVEKPKEDLESKNDNSEDGQNDQPDKNGINTDFSEDGQNEQAHNEQSQKVQSNNNNLNSNNLNSNNNISSSSNEDEEEVKKILEICQLQNYKLSKKDIKALLLVYPFNRIAKAIITATSTESVIKNFKGYLVSVLNDMDKIKKVDINVNKNDSKKSNANFTQRDQDMSELEKKLLGWEE